MNFAFNFPLFLIVLSLMVSVFSSILNWKATRFLSMALAVVSVAMNACVYFSLDGQVVYYLMGHFPRPWGNELRLDALASVMSCIFSTVLFLTVLGGEEHLNNTVPDWKRRYFYIMCDLVQASLIALAYTNDIFTGYVFIEICTLSSCGLIMIRRNGKTILASVRYMVFALIGSGLFLFGVVFLYNITGHLLMPNIKEAVAGLWATGQYRVPLLTSICLITIGLGVKSGMCPFHLWMADTYGAAIPAASGILSGLVSKIYILFLVKVILSVFGPEVFYASGVQNVLFVLGVAGVILGSVSAIRENNILRMTAFSSAAQIGYIYMGIGISPTLGLLAALFHMVAHAVTKPAVFVSAGLMCDAVGGKKQFRNLQGAGYANPLAGICFSFGAFSMIGIPLTVGFMSKYMFGMAAFRSRPVMVVTLLALAVSTILNTLYFARTILRLYNRNEISGRTVVHMKDQMSFTVAAVAFMLLNLYFGICSSSLVQIFSNALSAF